MNINNNTKQLLARIGAVTSAITLVLAGSWYAVRHIEPSTNQVNSSASDGQIIILDAGHGECS